RVILDGEDRQFSVLETLDGAVVQVDVRDLETALIDAGRVDRVAVVLAGDVDAPGAQILHRVVAAPVAEAELEGARPKGLADDLVAQADPEDRLLADKGASRPHHLLRVLRIAGSRREGDAIWAPLQD